MNRPWQEHRQIFERRRLNDIDRILDEREFEGAEKEIEEEMEDCEDDT